GFFELVEGYLMKKGFVMNSKIIGLVLALLLLILVLQLIFPKTTDANSRLHSLKCKYVPFGCDENSDDEDKPGSGNDKKSDFERNYEAGLNDNLKTTEKKLSGFSEVKNIIENSKCKGYEVKKDETVYLLKSKLNDRPYYLLHIKGDGKERYRNDYYAVVDEMESEELLSSVKEEGYTSEHLIFIDHFLTPIQRKAIEDGNVNFMMPTLGFVDKLCRVEDMQKMPANPEISEADCKIFEEINKIETKCG
ncbi:MAG: hypothetical protein ACQESF_00225, partial [Nanobdellota archaeon]